MQGMGMSHEISNIAEAEPVRHGEGYANGTGMRGVAALPGSKDQTAQEHRAAVSNHYTDAAHDAPATKRKTNCRKAAASLRLNCGECRLCNTMPAVRGKFPFSL